MKKSIFWIVLTLFLFCLYPVPNYGQEVTTKELTKVKDKLSETQNQVTEIAGRLISLEQEMVNLGTTTVALYGIENTLSVRLDILTKQTDDIKKRLDVFEGALQNIAQENKFQDKKIGDIEESVTDKKRSQGQENTSESLRQQEKIDALKLELTKSKGQVEDLDKSISLLQEQIVTLQEKQQQQTKDKIKQPIDRYLDIARSPWFSIISFGLTVILLISHIF